MDVHNAEKLWNNISEKLILRNISRVEKIGVSYANKSLPLKENRQKPNTFTSNEDGLKEVR